MGTALAGVASVAATLLSDGPYGVGDYVWAVLGGIAMVGGVALALLNRSEQRRPHER
jgi:hypothetical protein